MSGRRIGIAQTKAVLRELIRPRPDRELLREGVVAITVARALALAFLAPYLVWVQPPHAIWLGVVIVVAGIAQAIFAWFYLRADGPAVSPRVVLLTLLVDIIGLLGAAALADGAHSSVVPFMTPVCVVAAIWLGFREAIVVGLAGALGIVAVEASGVAPAFDVTSAQRTSSVVAALLITVLIGTLIGRTQVRTQGALTSAERLARRDPLTGLLNRLGLAERIDFEIARAIALESQIAVIIADIDDFKGFNTRLGYVEGDRVLVRVANAVAGEGRRSDLAVRLGGEEFLMLVEVDSVRDAESLAERLRSRIARDGSGPAVTVSVGIAVAPLHASRPAELIRLADVALRTAKDEGKNRTRVYSSDMPMVETQDHLREPIPESERPA